MTRYRWVADRKAEGFPTTMSCRVAQVSRQAFYDWRDRAATGPTDVEIDVSGTQAARLAHSANQSPNAPRSPAAAGIAPA